MIDDRNPSNDAGEDPEVDALFASAGRFPTQMDFEDRVLRVVRLPLPDWALKLRTSYASLFRSRAGLVVLSGAGLCMVMSITFITRWVAINGHRIGEGLGRWVGPLPSARALVSGAMDFLASLLPVGLATRSNAMIAAGVVGVSAVGLYITAGPPALRSRNAR